MLKVFVVIASIISELMVIFKQFILGVWKTLGRYQIICKMCLQQFRLLMRKG